MSKSKMHPIGLNFVNTKLYNVGTDKSHTNLYPLPYDDAVDMQKNHAPNEPVNELTDVEYACFYLFTGWGIKNNADVRTKLQELIDAGKTPREAAQVWVDYNENLVNYKSILEA